MWERAADVEVGQPSRGEVPNLLVQRVVEKVKGPYLDGVGKFLAFAEKEGDPTKTAGMIDRALTWFFEWLCNYKLRGGLRMVFPH